MSRTRLSLFFGSLLLLFTVVVWAVIFRWANTVPMTLSGDAWDYAIQLADVPAGWAVGQQTITTPYDVEQAKLEAAAALTETVALTETAALQNMTQMYAVSYQPPETSPYVDLTCQVILYQTEADAKAGLAVETPSSEWESVAAPAVADEARLWHFINPDEAVSQNIYRLDFRYINGIASITLMGTAVAVPDANELTSYAALILNRMKQGMEPADLKPLRSAGFADLRPYLLTQTQLAQADPQLGNRWMWATEQLPTWTPTSSMSEGAQKALAPLNRVMGYQGYLYKSLTQAELNGVVPVLLFQQVTAYKEAVNAQKGLDMMIGIPQLQESANPPQIGDGQAHAWRGELSTTASDGTQLMVAVSEIDFRVGNYVASVKLQSRPLSAQEISQADLATKTGKSGEALIQIMQLTETLSKLLAENLQKAAK